LAFIEAQKLCPAKDTPEGYMQKIKRAHAGGAGELVAE